MKRNILLALLVSYTFLAFAQTKQTETAFSIDKYQPVGITISKDNRAFVSFPNWLPEYKYAVVEIFPDNSYKPYPNEFRNNWMEDKQNNAQFISVQNIVTDSQNNLWILDPANPQLSNAIISNNGIKLIKIDMASDSISRIYYFPSQLVGENSFLNDIRIDEKHQMAYIADPNQKALIILNLENGEVRRVLKDHTALVADKNFIFSIDGSEMLDMQGNPFSSNINGIAISTDFEWFYFRPETDTRLFRIATKYLSDSSLNDQLLSSHIEYMGIVGQSNGITMDSKGNVYLSAAMEKAIKRIKPNGEIEILAQGDEFQWPDTFALSPDEDYLLVTISQINKMSWFNDNKDLIEKPYKIIKIKL